MGNQTAATPLTHYQYITLVRIRSTSKSRGILRVPTAIWMKNNKCFQPQLTLMYQPRKDERLSWPNNNSHSKWVRSTNAMIITVVNHSQSVRHYTSVQVLISSYTRSHSAKPSPNTQTTTSLRRFQLLFIQPSFLLLLKIWLAQMIQVFNKKAASPPHMNCSVIFVT